MVLQKLVSPCNVAPRRDKVEKQTVMAVDVRAKWQEKITEASCKVLAVGWSVSRDTNQRMGDDITTRSMIQQGPHGLQP